ncbi:MAG: dienelactone hydrolase family protein [Ardenticatenaceae bacterium]|nr:dienelactone hydrolase family protein [Ardenticatenaceae bacterium]
MKTIFRWIWRIVLGAAALIGVLILILLGTIVYDSQTGEQVADNTNVDYAEVDGQQLRGYLATPDTPGPHPAVLLIHEWWGLNHGMTVLADALAAEGYVVFAPDVYRGNLAQTVPYALWLRLGTPTDDVYADVDSALTWLRSREDVEPERVASMGFCFGGGHSLQLGMRQSENLALTIMYYGAVVTEPDLLRPLVDGQPVLGIFGAEDTSIPTQEVLEFEAALNSLNIENEITIYDGVGHAFLTEENYNEAGAAGDAWQQTLAFLEENIGN